MTPLRFILAAAAFALAACAGFSVQSPDGKMIQLILDTRHLWNNEPKNRSFSDQKP